MAAGCVKPESSRRPAWSRSTPWSTGWPKITAGHGAWPKWCPNGGQRAGCQPDRVRTNIVTFRHPDADALLAHLGAEGIRAGTIAPGIVRLVTHHDVGDDDIERAVQGSGSGAVAGLDQEGVEGKSRIRSWPSSWTRRPPRPWPSTPTPTTPRCRAAGPLPVGRRPARRSGSASAPRATKARSTHRSTRSPWPLSAARRWPPPVASSAWPATIFSAISTASCSDDDELRGRLVALIRRLRPEAVMCPDPTAVFFGEHYVNHRDHRVVGWATLDATTPAAGMPHYFPNGRGTSPPGRAVSLGHARTRRVGGHHRHHRPESPGAGLPRQSGRPTRRVAPIGRASAGRVGRPPGGRALRGGIPAPVAAGLSRPARRPTRPAPGGGIRAPVATWLGRTGPTGWGRRQAGRRGPAGWSAVRLPGRPAVRRPPVRLLQHPLLSDGLPFTHGPKHEHGDDRHADGRDDGADDGARPLRRRTRTVTLDAHEAVADQGAADAGDEDGPEGDGPGLARGQRRHGPLRGPTTGSSGSDGAVA